MSSVARGIKKVFKPVFKAVKKIAPYALLAGAVVFSAGAALGVAGMAGGWSAAAASVGTAIGGSGTLGTVLTGAIYQAGVGSAIGGGLAAVTGKDIGKGISSGAAIGAATGAATGLLAPSMVSTQTLAQANAPAAGTSTVGQGAGAITSEALPAAAPNPANGAQVADASAAIKPPSPISVEGAGGAAAPSWLERNQGIVGPAISTAGTGLLAAAQGSENPSEERAGEVRENYGPASSYTGLLRRDSLTPDTTVRPTTQERFNTSFEYRWDPSQRRLVKVATAA